MFLSPLKQMKYPRFNALLRDIKPWVNANPNIKKELLDYTGNNEDRVNMALEFKYGSVPYIIPKVILPDQIELDPKKFKDKKNIKHKLLEFRSMAASYQRGAYNEIDIEEYNIILLEQAKQTGLVNHYAFFFAFTLLHELAHFLRDVNDVGRLSRESSDEAIAAEEKHVYRFQERALNFDEKMGTDKWRKKISSYAIPHIPFFINLHKRLEEEKAQKEEGFDLEEFRVTHLPQRLW